MTDILKTIQNELPKCISEANFEGANIVLYTEDREFFLEGESKIKGVVDKIKKRIELRAEEKILESQETTEKIIRELVPAEAEITNIIFDIQRSIVVIEAKKPGLVIGKGGSVLQEIKRKTFWIPQIQRSPAIQSKITENIRSVLYLNNNYRRKFLNSIGKKIYKEWNPEKVKEWVRLTFLGGARQVGRSCLLLHTPESKILLDCGIDVAASNSDKFPFFDVSEFDINQIDAVIVSHAHLDHVGVVPYLYKMGYKGPVYLTTPTMDIASLLALDFIGVAYKKATTPLFSSTDIKEMVKHSICLNYNEVTDITPDVRLTFYNAGHCLGCVTSDTLIVLADGSVKEIREVVGKPNPTPVQPLSMNSELKIVPSQGIAFKKIYNAHLYNIKTAVGSLITTPEHPFFTIKNSEIKEKRVDELIDGDYIAVPKRININGKTQKLRADFQGSAHNTKHIKIQKRTSPKLMQLIGYLLGDGCRIIPKPKGRRKQSITITLTDKNVPNLYRYENLIEGLFGIKGKIIKTGKKRYELLVYSTEFARFLELNFPGILEYSPKRKIPQIICKSTNEDVAKFLRGLFDAESSVGKDKIEIGLTSKNIIEIIKIFLLRLGILSQQSEKEQSGIGKNKVYRLVITDRESVDKFSSLVGFSDENKKEKLNALKNSPRHPKMKSMRGIPNIHQELRYIRKKLRLSRRDFEVTIKHYESGKHKISIEGLRLVMNRFEQRLREIGQLKKNFSKHDLWKIKDMLRTSIYKIGKATKISPQIIHYRMKKTKRADEIETIKNILLKDLDDILNDKKLHNYLNFLKLIYKGEIGWEKIKIHKIKNNYGEVYDLSIPEHQSFITNGIISHNSAMIHLNIGNGLHNLLYTGDFKFGKTRLLDPASIIFPRLETAIIESTYGGRENVLPSRQESEEQLIETIRKTIERQGKILIPELGLGRAQETMLIIEDAINQGKLPKINVYIDGMIWDINAIHTAYPDFLSGNVRNLIFQDKNPFVSELFQRVGSSQERKQVIEGPSCVVLATSGMLVGGASVEYFKEFAGNKRNSIIFVCYQGVGSLGRQIQDGLKEVKMSTDGKEEDVKVNLEVNTIDGLTAHSGRNQLLAFINKCQPKPKRVIINHGEVSRSLDLASTIYKLNRIETSVPRNLETIRIR